MNIFFKIFLSMSFSGGVLILVLLLGKKLLKDKISRQWQYYIWLVVILRLLLPFSPETNLIGKCFQPFNKEITADDVLPQQSLSYIPEDVNITTVGSDTNSINADVEIKNLTEDRSFAEIRLINYLWVIWLITAVGMLIRKITVYQSFIHYLKTGAVPVSDLKLLNCLSTAKEQIGIKKRVELFVNPMISSPLTFGFFRPCIVLPSENIPEKDSLYIVLHELTHCKRRDMFYKWLVQITVCLHWFNPFVHFMSREIGKACEFACDEAVLTKTGYDSAQDYGKTLLDAMAAVGKSKKVFGTVNLSENKQLLKERLGAIMRFKKPSKTVKFLTAALTLCISFGAAFIGVYPAAAETTSKTSAPNDCNYDDCDDWDWSEDDWDWSEDDWDWNEDDWDWNDDDWEQSLIDEYDDFGIEKDGKSYYYQGKLINVFLDCRADSSFYTLDMNPKGTVNIKVIRNRDNIITGVSYLTDSELTELIDDEND